MMAEASGDATKSSAQFGKLIPAPTDRRAFDDLPRQRRERCAGFGESKPPDRARRVPVDRQNGPFGTRKAENRCRDLVGHPWQSCQEPERFDIVTRAETIEGKRAEFLLDKDHDPGKGSRLQVSRRHPDQRCFDDGRISVAKVGEARIAPAQVPVAGQCGGSGKPFGNHRVKKLLERGERPRASAR